MVTVFWANRLIFVRRRVVTYGISFIGVSDFRLLIINASIVYRFVRHENYHICSTTL